MRVISKAAVAAIAFGIVVAAGIYARKQGPHLDRSPADAAVTAVHAYDAYRDKIQPILNKRCVVCHSCFNAPCQLKLTAFEGLDRGGSKSRVYDADRLEAIPPTRLFEDASSTEQWQSKMGFFPVTGDFSGAGGDPMKTALYRLLAYKSAHPSITQAVYPDADRACAKDTAELDDYLKANPEGGMPLGFPPLAPEEYSTLMDWIKAGAPGPSAPAENEAVASLSSVAGRSPASTQKWDLFLNSTETKHRIAARYIYEHLFLGHIYFDGNPSEFYRLVRSRSAWPEPVDEIPTVRPYDDPQVSPFYYRFKRVAETIVHKTHSPYLLDDAKLARFKELFIDVAWDNPHPEFPSYKTEIASNPFLTFKDIPAISRYRFLLDDALYHVSTFIRGPVCKGNVALNVINDHFFIFFLNPGVDPTVTHAEFLPKVAKYLKIPAEGGDGLGADYGRYKLAQLAYEKRRRALYKKSVPSGLGLTDIWDGDGVNDNAVLTIYRHFDNADVYAGALGGIPKTAWVLDYPIFERIYYNLVAGFNVFGNVLHQTSTRRYMDNLRIEGEDLFLDFLPTAERTELRKQWYRGVLSEVAMDFRDRDFNADPETRIAFSDPKNAKEEFIQRVLGDRFNPTVRGLIDRINLPGRVPPLESEKVFQEITGKTGPFVHSMPEVSFVRVSRPDGEASAYTVIHNKEHLNVSFLFLESKYLDPAADTLNVLEGFDGSYPTFFFDVASEKLAAFVHEISGLDGENASFLKLVDEFGVRRSDPRFWEISDWMSARFKKDRPIDAGVYDLTKYENY